MLIYIHIFEFCPLQHSLIAMSSCLHFLDLSECDRTVTSSVLSISNSISPSHMHSIETVECLLCILVSRRHKDKH